MSRQVAGAANTLSAWKSARGPGGCRGPSLRAAPRCRSGSRPPRACPARGPMCSAAARALPAGARGWRAARDVTAARARAAGEGEARAARPAACVPGPRAPGARGPRLLPAPRAPPPAAGAARVAQRPGAARGGGAGLGRLGCGGPRRRWAGGGERDAGYRERGWGERSAPAGVPAALAPGPERTRANPAGMPARWSAAISSLPLPAFLPILALWKQGVFPLAGWGR